MKTLSIKKKDLVDALGQMTHTGFAGEGWSWQVIFDPKDFQAAGRVVVVNPDADHEVNYRLVNEEGFNVLEFADLEGFTWDAGDAVADREFDDIKDLEQIRLSPETRDYIARRLRQHVQIGKDTFKIEYF